MNLLTAPQLSLLLFVALMVWAAATKWQSRRQRRHDDARARIARIVERQRSQEVPR